MFMLGECMSEWFNPRLTTATEEVNNLVNEIYIQLDGYKKELKKEALISIISNIRMYKDVRVTRDKNDYTKFKNENNPFYTYKIMVQMFDFLEEIGLIEQFSPPMLWSRINGTEMFYNKLEFFKRENIYKKELYNKLILKQNDNYISYKETRKTIEMKKTLEDYKYINKFKVSLKIEPNEFKKLSNKAINWIMYKYKGFIITEYERELIDNDLESSKVEKYKKLRKRMFTYTHTFCSSNLLLHRVFNVINSGKIGRNHTFYYGGRFYGSEIQNIPKELRKFIFIDEKETCEPDFSALHPRMLYHLEEIDFKDDPYKSKYRDLMKLVGMIVINASDKKSSVYAIRSKFRKGIRKGDLKYEYNILKDNFIKKLMKEFEENNEQIKKYFYTGKGIELQAMDSDIINEVLNYFIDKNILIIPIHDSIIIQTKHREECIKVMNEKYKEKIGFEPIIK